MVRVTDEERTTLVDLLNTTPVVEGRSTELLDGSWLRAHHAGRLGVADARRLRDDLQAVVRGDAEPEVLDGYLRGVTQTPAVVGAAVRWHLHAEWTARMVLAWGEFEVEMPGRLRPCANDECQLFLLDRSRGGTGRWCSMSECGNRMKARRHYGRTAGRAT